MERSGIQEQPLVCSPDCVRATGFSCRAHGARYQFPAINPHFEGQDIRVSVASSLMGLKLPRYGAIIIDEEDAARKEV